MLSTRTFPYLEYVSSTRSTHINLNRLRNFDIPDTKRFGHVFSKFTYRELLKSEMITLVEVQESVLVGYFVRTPNSSFFAMHILDVILNGESQNLTAFWTDIQLDFHYEGLMDRYKHQLTWQTRPYFRE